MNKREQVRVKMYAHYQEWEVSGMSIKGFAKSHGLVPGTFYGWCKKFSLQAGKDVFDKPVTKKPDMELDSRAGFSQIAIASSSTGKSTSSPAVIIRFPGQISVECYEADLSEVLKYLSSNDRRDAVN